MIKVAIIGATGAVGRIMLEDLAALKLPIEKVGVFASPKKFGQELPFQWSKT